jgi:2-oxoglutarate ferredoxin oxidoreductase subunit beta
VAIFSPAETIKAKRAIKKAFDNQLQNKGFSLVEVLSPCPTYWNKSPQEAVDWIKDEMTKIFPLGIYKDV